MRRRPATNLLEERVTLAEARGVAGVAGMGGGGQRVEAFDAHCQAGKGGLAGGESLMPAGGTRRMKTKGLVASRCLCPTKKQSEFVHDGVWGLE
jgi:hypothetical protein